VIISSGVIGSPQLLLLSGIGPADDLSPLGIDVRADLPGVGENLHDHALATTLYASAREIPPGTANNLEAHFFAASDPAMVAPDLQPLMSHFPMPVEGYPVPDYGWGYAIVAGIIRPLSRGRLWLRSANPAEAPALDPHYLEDPADVRALLAALRPVDLPDQLVHADLAGNVLFADGAAPAVIDFSPLERPAGLPLAVVAVDTLTWRRARPEVLSYLAGQPEIDQLLARAQVYRLVTEIVAHAGTPGTGAVARAAHPVTDLILARLAR